MAQLTGVPSRAPLFASMSGLGAAIRLLIPTQALEEPSPSQPSSGIQKRVTWPPEGLRARPRNTDIVWWLRERLPWKTSSSCTRASPGLKIMAARGGNEPDRRRSRAAITLCHGRRARMRRARAVNACTARRPHTFPKICGLYRRRGAGRELITGITAADRLYRAAKITLAPERCCGTVTRDLLRP